MDSVELLMKFADPELMKTLSGTERLVAGLITTVLGMGITFLSLIILQFITAYMEKLSGKKVAEPQITTAPQAPTVEQEQVVDIKQDEELVAVLSAAIAMKMKTSVGNIVIRNIERIEDKSPTWSKAGIIEQLNNSV